MPELPEVETIRRGLNKLILKQKLTKIDILCEKSFLGTPITGTVTAIRRFGKALVLDFNNGHSFIIHLRMTGQLIYDSDGKFTSSGAEPHPARSRYAAGHPSDNFIAALPNKQTRVILHFTNGILYFNDQRKFGFIKPTPTSEVEKDPFICKLAKEPWQMTAQELHDRLQKHSNSLIKATILDQTIICGLGNIYADEALFTAGIHPERRSGSLSLEDATRLLEAAKSVMQTSIDSGGSTMATYVKADGTKGDYLDKFAQVFHREGQACYCCGTPIIKIKVAGRGTHICPHCQSSPLSNSQASAYRNSANSRKKAGQNA